MAEANPIDITPQAVSHVAAALDAIITLAAGGHLPFTLIVWSPSGAKHFTTASCPRESLPEGMRALAAWVEAELVSRAAIAAAAPRTAQ